MSSSPVDVRCLVRARDLTVRFRAQGGELTAVNGVSLEVPAGRTLGIVGESGCGKTTLGRALLRLTSAVSGAISFDGVDVLALSGRRLREFRRNMQMIFQDPGGSLNPRMNVRAIVGDPLAAHGLAKGKIRRTRVGEMLERVGLDASFGARYPHELSGGQRQRVAIARALVLEPKFLVCDEPVAALDAVAQAEILTLLAEIRDAMGLSLLLITHNLAMAERFCDEIAVMYFGSIVEQGPASQLFAQAAHPYTQALRASILPADPASRGCLSVPSGEVPSPFEPPTGCAFHPRCPQATDQCRLKKPALREYAHVPEGRRVACDQLETTPVP